MQPLSQAVLLETFPPEKRGAAMGFYFSLWHDAKKGGPAPMDPSPVPALPVDLSMYKGITFWAMAADQKDVAHILVEGIAAAPPDFVDAALDRMESMQNGLFWEVNERVIAFDWVEQPLRAEIPRLRAALRRAKASGHDLAIELDAAVPVAQNLVSPEPNGTPAAGGGVAQVSAETSG